MKNHTSLALGFIGLILLGAVALAGPWARVTGAWGDPLAALFTSCSAVCVTGLSVLDVGAEYTRTGQVILLSLVELGCLGLMTAGTFVLVAIGRRLSLAREFSLANAYGVAQVQGVRGLICWVVGSMLVIEAVFAAALYPNFGTWYEAWFYSVMSFCNAGFSLTPDSLARFRTWYPLGVMGIETILGGIGFLVLFNLSTFWFLRRPSGSKGRLSLHTRVVLRVTAWLLLIAFVAFLAIEWSLSLKGMSLGEKLAVGFYQAVTPRTCGFSVVPTEGLHPLTRLVYSLLMFVGGAPGSAAAGVKVTTLAVLLYTLRALCRGESDIVIAKRVVPTDVVRESIVIFVVVVAFIAIVTGTLLVTERESGIADGALFFEAVSAVTTTGLSVGDTTAHLSSVGRLVIMAAMFFGRLGALTVVMMIGDREAKSHVRYPTEELVVG